MNRIEKTLCLCLLCGFIGFFPAVAAEEAEERKAVNIDETFHSSLIDNALAFPSRDVFFIQGTHVSSPHPEGYGTHYNSFDKFDIADKDGNIVAACTFELGILNAPGYLKFKQEKRELADMSTESQYKTELIKKISSNEDLLDDTRMMPELKIVDGPKIEQNTDRSFFTIADVQLERSPLTNLQKKTTIAVLHGYVVFRDRSRQFIALADREAYGVDGAAVFVTWLNKFLEWNK